MTKVFRTAPQLTPSALSMEQLIVHILLIVRHLHMKAFLDYSSPAIGTPRGMSGYAKHSMSFTTAASGVI